MLPVVLANVALVKLLPLAVAAVVSQLALVLMSDAANVLFCAPDDIEMAVPLVAEAR